MEKVTDACGLKKAIEILTPLRETCLYLYCNVLKYGYGDANFEIFLEESSQTVVGIYYGDSLHICTKEIITEPVWALIQQRKPRTIFSSVPIDLSGKYDQEITDVFKLAESKTHEPAADNVQNLSKADIKELTDFLYINSEVYRRTYDKKLLEKQLLQRLEDSYSRYFGIYHEKQIIGCAFTKAEVGDVMIVGGILVAPAFRGRGAGKTLCAYKGMLAGTEGKTAYCFIDRENRTSVLLHTSVGYKKTAQVFKYTLYRE